MIGLHWPEQLMAMMSMIMMMTIIFSDKGNFGLHPISFAHCQIVH